MSGSGGLSKLGITLTIIFVVSLVALFAEIFYVLWRRRVFHRQANAVGGDHLSQDSSSDSAFSSLVSSKDLLYFFCIRPNSHLDRGSINATNSSNDLDSNQKSDMEVIDIDLLKLPSMFGPPRFLFPIKEEEIEDLESRCSSAEKEVKKSDGGNKSRVSLKECFKEAEESTDIPVEIDDDTMPFSTPCASPMYFTPSASPANDEVKSQSTEEGRINSEYRTTSFRKSEV